MSALGDRPTADITTRDLSAFLRELDDRGCKPRTVNRFRQLISAAFNYAIRDDTYAIAHNPAANTTKRREPPPAVLDFYEPDEVEQLAHAAELGGHRAAPTSRSSQMRRRSPSSPSCAAPSSTSAPTALPSSG